MRYFALYPITCTLAAMTAAMRHDAWGFISNAAMAISLCCFWRDMARCREGIGLA